MQSLLLYREGDRGDEVPQGPPWWHGIAACDGMDTDLFFAEDAESVAEAKAACGRCVAAKECRADALADPSICGTWGGLTEHERREVRAGRPAVDITRAPRRRKPKTTPAAQGELRPCGTPAAYARHLRRGEDPCDDCREANRAKSAEAQRKRRGQAPRRELAPCGTRHSLRVGRCWRPPSAVR